MTTDNFAEAAHAEAERRFEHYGSPGPFDYMMPPEGVVDREREVFASAAEWARTYLAAQEPTDAEVRAVKIALIQDEYRVVPGNELVMIRQLGREGEYDGRARAALSAARAARRDEEAR